MEESESRAFVLDKTKTYCIVRQNDGMLILEQNSTSELLGCGELKMIGSLLITVVSIVLLVYWFRYSCLLLLNASPAAQQAGALARADRLGFLDVQKTLLAAPNTTALEDLHRSLDNDHRILTYLLEQSSGLDLSVLERRLVMLDYSLMRMTFRLARRVSPDFARQTLLEMSRVLGFLSQKMGERVAQHHPMAA